MNEQRRLILKGIVGATAAFPAIVKAGNIMSVQQHDKMVKLNLEGYSLHLINPQFAEHYVCNFVVHIQKYESILLNYILDFRKDHFFAPSYFLRHPDTRVAATLMTDSWTTL